MVGMAAELGPYFHSVVPPLISGIEVLSSEAAADELNSPLAFCAGGPVIVAFIISAAGRLGVDSACAGLAA